MSIDKKHTFLYFVTLVLIPFSSLFILSFLLASCGSDYGLYYNYTDSAELRVDSLFYVYRLGPIFFLKDVFLFTFIWLYLFLKKPFVNLAKIVFWINLVILGLSFFVIVPIFQAFFPNDACNYEPSSTANIGHGYFLDGSLGVVSLFLFLYLGLIFIAMPKPKNFKLHLLKREMIIPVIYFLILFFCLLVFSSIYLVDRGGVWVILFPIFHIFAFILYGLKYI